MAGKGRNIIVMGASAGGLEALDTVVSQLPADLPAAIFVVQHMSAENSGDALLQRLSSHQARLCKLARDGEEFRNGGIYIAPADQHLLVKKTTLLVTKGARENRFRPAIDPLFRSAAVNHGSRVIGVVLSGLLDDGTAGLIAIKKCGGLTVVQDPADALHPEMPQSALNNLQVHHCLPAAQMSVLLDKLVRQSPGKSKPVPDDVRAEAAIAERVLSDVGQVGDLGQQVPYNCPNCGGVLWELDSSDIQRFRCHTGHSYTASSLLASQSERIEETLWVSLRMFEERKNLLTNLAHKASAGGPKRQYLQRRQETEIHIERVRKMLRGTK